MGMLKIPRTQITEFFNKEEVVMNLIFEIKLRETSKRSFSFLLFVTKKLHLFVETRYRLFAMSGVPFLTFDAVSPLKIEK